LATSSHGAIRLRDSATWQQALTVVDFSGIAGPLRFYIAEAVDETTIELTHRDGGQPPIPVDTHQFHLRYMAARETSVDPHRTGIVFDVLREMVPPLCETCGRVVPAGSLCIECRTSQIEDLLRMTDPWVPAP
jgi:hypothetical protein